jgi:hypothetical protein
VQSLIYWLAVSVLVHVLLMVFLVDRELISSGQPTISDWLRLNPLAFWIPIVVGLVAAVGLWLHLWGR